MDNARELAGAGRDAEAFDVVLGALPLWRPSRVLPVTGKDPSLRQGKSACRHSWIHSIVCGQGDEVAKVCKACIATEDWTMTSPM
jgi:hypothetical protein